MQGNFLRVATLATALAAAGTAQADPLNIIFTTHASATNVFFQAVKKGFDDACARIEANCQMIFTQGEHAVDEQVANFAAAVAQKPDILITTIIDDQALDAPIKAAVDAGITVLASNSDDSQGAAGNARLGFIGVNEFTTGYTGAKAMAEFFPKEGPIKVAIGLSAPDRPWSQTRSKGMIKYLEEWKAEHTDRDISWETMASSTDPNTAAERVGAYLNANPGTTAYFDTGWFHVGVAQTLRDRGIEPGKILLNCFDLVPQCLQEIKSGYVQATVDQQPYTEGFMSVMNGYLMKNFKLDGLEVDTGKQVIRKEDVDAIIELSKEGVR